MKKLMTLILAFALIVTMAACGGNSSGDSSGDSGGGVSTPAYDLEAEISSIGKISEYDDAAKQAMIDEARAEGGDIDFKADGSVVYTDADGSKTVQNADGSWTVDTGDGGQFEVGSGDWPDNEFTKLLPKPDLPVSMTGVGTEDSDFQAVLVATIEQTRAYAEQVRDKGFTVDAETEDREIMGMSIYYYTAKNAAGYKVEVTFSGGMSVVTVKKP
ncbi:MAG: hypothetical protein LBN00_11365 [Oscillospiraceae bacterium]|jgi:hypothetical protein|nr:hypothetical protein [Oscillospiraceae bacterium]